MNLLNWSSAKTDRLCTIARAAGAVALRHRAAATENPVVKADGSPVTAADQESEAVILAGLASLTPDIPVIAEEKTNAPELAAGGTYWLVDPLDGTREYIAGSPEFTVNIGLCVAHQPVMGILYAPALDDLFFGMAGEVWRERQGNRSDLGVAENTTRDLQLITSKREAKRLPVQDWLAEGLISEWRICSSAYKFGLLAAGDYTCFLRTGTTFEWDTAAGDAILRALGAQILTLDGVPLPYNKPNFRNGSFICTLPGVSHSAVEKLIGQVKTVLHS